MKTKNYTDKIWNLALILLCLNLICMGGLGRTYAKYTTQASGSDTAQVAVWNATITSTKDDAGIYAGIEHYNFGEYETYGIPPGTQVVAGSDGQKYTVSQNRFQIESPAVNDVTRSLAIQVSLRDGDSWSSDMTAALYKVGGTSGSETYTQVGTAINSEGAFTFDNAGIIAIGSALNETYMISFHAPVTTPADTCKLKIKATLTQVD